MSNIDNTKLVVKLFEYKKSLALVDEDIERQVNYHMNLFNCDETGKNLSQKTIIRSLTEKLNPFTYNNSVKKILEEVNAEIKENELFYELEDLYRTLENMNQGLVYRPVMKIVLDIMNESNERDKQYKILSELKLHEWIPAVKLFMYKFTTDPRERKNITSMGGKCESVYTVVEKVEKNNEKGFLAWVGDRWFFIGEQIEYAVPSDYITDREKLNRVNLLQTALQISTMSEGKIYFKVDEDLKLGVSLDDSALYVNADKVDESASLDSIFDSPIIPYLRKDLYPVILETVRSRDKFVDLDIVQKVTNITNPTCEVFAFNFKDKMYVYSIDGRYGNHLYQYESATMLVSEITNQLGFDLSDFYKDKFKGDVKVRKELEEKEKNVVDRISEVSENINKIILSGLIEKSEEIKNAHLFLVEEKVDLEKQLFEIKSKLSNK